MGILTLLRNAFGRSRKGSAEAEGAEGTKPTVPSPSPEPSTPTSAAAQVPEQRPSTSAPLSTKDEHDLVSAAFDNVAVPKPGGPVDEQEPAAGSPETAPVVAEKATPGAAEEAVAEPVTEEAKTEEPAAEPTPVPAEEAVAETAVAEPATEEAKTEEPTPAPVEP
ncbi:VWA domain-containing protein, partial [Streptomyces sp. NPDC054837]